MIFLKRFGVVPAKAVKLIERYDASTVYESIKYLAANVLEGGRNDVSNPAGLIIYSLENASPIPATFTTFVNGRMLKRLRTIKANRTEAGSK